MYVLVLFLSCSTTCSTTWVYGVGVAKNDYRVGRRQVSFVVDEGLWGAVKAAAVAGGVSVTAFVTGLLEDAVVVERSVGGVGPDWDAIMAAGREVKVVYSVDTVVVDPLEEIA